MVPPKRWNYATKPLKRGAETSGQIFLGRMQKCRHLAGIFAGRKKYAWIGGKTFNLPLVTATIFPEHRHRHLLRRSPPTPWWSNELVIDNRWNNVVETLILKKTKRINWVFIFLSEGSRWETHEYSPELVFLGFPGKSSFLDIGNFISWLLNCTISYMIQIT